MLTELAATLYGWKNRNIVFEKAIRSVALELLAMAQEGMPPADAQPDQRDLPDARV